MLFYIDALDLPDNKKLYVLGQQNRHTLGLNFRASWAITPDVTLQYYGNPYVSAGNFSNFKVVTNPQADSYNDMFYTIPEGDMSYTDTDNEWSFNYLSNHYSVSNPNFEFQEFRSNFAFRWEFKPGSTFYAVWTHNRSGYHNLNNASLGNGLEQLASVSPINVFMIKLSYWLPI